MIKPAEETLLLQQKQDEQLVKITFQQTKVNSKKNICLDRRSMRCLRQSQPGVNNHNCWLTDEVDTSMYIENELL